jgi:hypothetical protein
LAFANNEQEHHLQAVISAAQAAVQGGGKVAQLFIPTPDAVASKLQYEDLYPQQFTQPATYIRFSSTVEDTIGCLYCMTNDDVAYLKSYNQKKGKTVQCSEDEFEEVMNFFEETSHTKQPFAAVDNTPVLSYEDLEAEFDETISDHARRFAKDIYNHWKNQRLIHGNRPLIPSLKFETNLETDDSDPYVCFRRREVRQIRKTRGRDAQVTEKLKKLRKELEEARFLMAQVKRRELLIRDQLAMDKQIFEQRSAVKEIKRKLSIKGDDEELLINQKVRIHALYNASMANVTAACSKTKTKSRCPGDQRHAGHGPQASDHSSGWPSGGQRFDISRRPATEEGRGYRQLHRRELNEAPEMEYWMGRSYLAAHHPTAGAGGVEVRLPSCLHKLTTSNAASIRF